MKQLTGFQKKKVVVSLIIKQELKSLIKISKLALILILLEIKTG